MEVPLLGVWCWFVICEAEKASLLFGLAAPKRQTDSRWGHWSAGAVYSQWVFVRPAPLTTSIVVRPFSPWFTAVNKHICRWRFLRSVTIGESVSHTLVKPDAFPKHAVVWISCCDFTSIDMQQLMQCSVYITVIKLHGCFCLEKEFNIYQTAHTSNTKVIETFRCFSYCSWNWMICYRPLLLQNCTSPCLLSCCYPRC